MKTLTSNLLLLLVLAIPQLITAQAESTLKSKFVQDGNYLSPNTTGVNPHHKPGSGGGQVNVAPCFNEDFELTTPGVYSASSAVAGWSLSSRFMNGCWSDASTLTWSAGAQEFSIQATPISGVPGIGTVPQSPL